jgi:hypothetical protein
MPPVELHCLCSDLVFIILRVAVVALVATTAVSGRRCATGFLPLYESCTMWRDCLYGVVLDRHRKLARIGFVLIGINQNNGTCSVSTSCCVLTGFAAEPLVS